MKKIIQTLTTIILIFMLLSTVTLPVTATNFDFEAAISQFESTVFNTNELKIGETHTPTSSIWAEAGNPCYSNNESVVTVAENGMVTAVGEGTAYVVYCGTGDMYKLYRYDVIASDLQSDNSTAIDEFNSIHNNPTNNAADSFDFETAISQFESTGFNTNELKIGETHTPTSSIWAEAGNPCYSSNESVVTVAENGTVTAVGEGTAYVVYCGAGDMYQLYRYDVITADTNNNTFLNNIFNRNEDNNNGTSSYRHNKNTSMSIFWAFFFCLLAINVYAVINMLLLSVNSIKKKELPAQKQTANTITTSMPDRENCPKCGKTYGDTVFCANCGISKKVKNTYTVPINKKMTAQEFEKVINNWFAENPFVYDCEIKLNTKARLLHLFVKRKFFVKSADIEFYVADKPQNHQYGMAFIYKFSFFGPIGCNNEKQVEKWQKNNPDCKIISTHSGKTHYIGSQSGYLAEYYNFVFFKK